MQKLRLGTTSRFLIYTLCLLAALSLLVFGSGKLRRAKAPVASLNSDNIMVAYNIDLEMDKARAEKTIEHYGEEMEDIVDEAIANNENNPEAKPTAENSYSRETTLNEVLPESIGEELSQTALETMQN